MEFIKSEEKRLVGGLVYVPNEEDAQGDWTTPAEIYSAMETFALNGHRIRFQHESDADAVVIECFQPDADTRKAGELVPAGAWYMTVKVLDDALWEKVKKGEVSGFSMSGKAKAI